MRKLVPGMSDKTDKATVFEFAARYIHFLKGFTGNKHDKVQYFILIYKSVGKEKLFPLHLLLSFEQARICRKIYMYQCQTFGLQNSIEILVHSKVSFKLFSFQNFLLYCKKSFH